jgi:hypothetical protein
MSSTTEKITIQLRKRDDETYGFKHKKRVITQINEGSIAKRAGLLKGDKIININNGLTLNNRNSNNNINLSLLVNSLDLTIERDIKKKSIKKKSIKKTHKKLKKIIIEKQPSEIFGIQLKNNEVILVDKDSVAEKAGLRKGDIIKNVNNMIMSNNISYEFIIDIFRQSNKLELTIKREYDKKTLTSNKSAPLNSKTFKSFQKTPRTNFTENGMLMITTGNNGNNACWINAALYGFLANPYILNLPDLLTTMGLEYNESLYDNLVQKQIMDMLHNFVFNSKQFWSTNYYDAILDLFNNYKRDAKLLSNIPIRSSYPDLPKKTSSYYDAGIIVQFLIAILQKGNNLEILHFDVVNKDDTTLLETITPSIPGYTLLSYVTSNICSKYANISHFHTYAKIDGTDNWIHTDLAYNPNVQRSIIKSSADVERELMCNNPRNSRVMYVISIKTEYIEQLKQFDKNTLSKRKTTRTQRKRRTLTANNIRGNPFFSPLKGGNPKTRKKSRK